MQIQIRHAHERVPAHLETVGANVLSGLVATVTNVGHFVLALETATNSVVNTLKKRAN